MKPLSWLRPVFLAAFAISLIGNFFSLGYIARSQQELPVVSALAESAFATYPRDMRMEYRRILRENRAQTVSALDKLRGARRELASAVSVSPVDEAAVDRALQDVRNATDALQRLMQDFLMQALKAKERAARHS